MTNRESVQAFFHRLRDATEQTILADLPIEFLHGEEVLSPITVAPLCQQSVAFADSSYLVGPPPPCSGQTF